MTARIAVAQVARGAGNEHEDPRQCTTENSAKVCSGTTPEPYNPRDGAKAIQDLTQELIKQFDQPAIEAPTYERESTLDAYDSPGTGIDRSPRDPWERGFEMIYFKQWRDAEAEFNRLLKRDATNYWFLHGYADAIAGQKRWAEAEAIYQIAIARAFPHIYSGYLRDPRRLETSDVGVLYGELNEVRKKLKKPAVRLMDQPWEKVQQPLSLVGPPIDESHHFSADGLTETWAEPDGSGHMWFVYVRNVSNKPIRIERGRVVDCVAVGLGCGDTGAGYPIGPGISARITTVFREFCTNPVDERTMTIPACEPKERTSFRWEYTLKGAPKAKK